jgi:peptidoglycan/xylan/chitin deacetylase (PgdA/CDA1 family)
MSIPGQRSLIHFARFVRSKCVKHGVILGYHRVDDSAWDPLRLAVSRNHFSQQLEVLRERANLLSLAELVDARAHRRIPRHSVAVTFDDGYADFLSTARPLLTQAGCPSTIFVSTGYLGQEFWWDTLTRVAGTLNPAEPLTLDAGTANLQWRPGTGTHVADRNVFLRVLHRFLLPLSASAREQLLNNLAERVSATASDQRLHPVFTQSEIQSLAGDELVTIGCHTVSHPRLALLPAALQRSEIIESKRALERLTGQRINGFSFPHGSTSDIAIRIVRECGFTYACASQTDIVWQKSDPLCLPRIWVPDCGPDAFLKLLNRWL